MHLKIHPDAEEELFHGAAWYDDRRVGLGEDFLSHVYRWLEVIGQSPSSWPRWPGTPEDLVPPIRRALLERFPFAVGYQAFADYVLILTVAHCRRTPLYWLQRLDH